MGVLVSLEQDLSAQVIPVYAMEKGLAAQASAGYGLVQGSAVLVGGATFRCSFSIIFWIGSLKSTDSCGFTSLYR